MSDWIELRAHLGPETVQVEVSDPGGSFEPAAETPLRSGLWILDRIADRWGVVRNGATRVWFETDLEPSSIDAPTEPSAQEHRGEPRGRPADAPIVAPWEKAARGWPEEAREAARGLYRLHGPPDEIDEDHLTWRRPGAFELTIRRAVLPPDTNPVGLGKKPQ